MKCHKKQARSDSVDSHTRLSTNSNTKARFEVATGYTTCEEYRDHTEEREFLQSINEPSSVDAPTVQRSGLGRPATASFEEEEAYLTVDRSEILGRHAVEQLARGDTIPMLDIVQRHHDVPFYSGDTTDEQDVLDILERSGVTYIVQNALLRQGARDPSVYFRGYVEGTRAIIEAAITAGVCRLVYTSSAGVVFDSTDVVNVDERVPYLEKPFDAYNDAQGVFGSRDSQIGGSGSLFDCTYNGNITRTILLAGNELVPPPSYSSTMSSEPKLDPERSFLSLVFMTFHSRIYGSKVLDKVGARLLISEGKEDSASSWVECEELLTKLRKGKFEAKVPFSVLIRTLSTARYRHPGAKEKAIDGDGRLEAVHQYLASRLCPPDCEVEGQRPRSNKVSTFTRRGRRPITEGGSRIYELKVTGFIRAQTCATLKYLVSSSEKVVNEDGRLEVAQRHLEQGLRPPDEIPDEV
ncbi:hypothetical protein BKA82DRAFT_4432149 [Pisolithus tinctorius]|nr:hypothetical protein BKA82DRAFT_4432149 [Pisolithus tinctorius]